MYRTVTFEDVLSRHFSTTTLDGRVIPACIDVRGVEIFAIGHRTGEFVQSVTELIADHVARRNEENIGLPEYARFQTDTYPVDAELVQLRWAVPLVGDDGDGALEDIVLSWNDMDTSAKIEEGTPGAVPVMTYYVDYR